ncbi:hypothetical protein WJX73_008499 [Symbiochloris irregularis]|uniref:Protein kinase domain-containing protein n=1 Tax=Symbiochloris irregularis TaxID=706552 RepID=A0AAW1NQB2_9CHLO
MPSYGKDAYVLVGQLGTGRNGTMKLMRNKKTKELVAAKWVPRTVGGGLSKNTEREIVNHRKLLHPNIIRFREVYMTDEHLVIVMEYASNGQLLERIDTSGKLDEPLARKLYQQLMDGMNYSHKQDIYHRDLRMENLLLDGSFFEPVLKISDFSYSKNAVLDSQPKTNVGTPAYTPPELLLAVRNEGAAYDGAAIDVWSSGIILYYMLAGHLPFTDPAVPNALSRKMMQRIVNVQYEYPADHELSPEAQDLIKHIFVAEPAQRIQVDDILKHPWLSGIPLPTRDDLEVAPQTEDDIRDIVERARQRRLAKRTSLHKIQSGIQTQSEE